MNLSTGDDLLKGAKAFDVNVLGAIYDLYSPGIFRYAMRLMGDEFMAEECVADTFSRFLKALRMGHGPNDHLQAYLYRIAHNWITDSYRRQAPVTVALDEVNQVDEHVLPEKQSEINLEQEQVRLVLRSLTPDQRQVVTLKFMEGWENDEIAAALEKPVGAVKALQHRAMSALRKMLNYEKGRSYGSEERV